MRPITLFIRAVALAAALIALVAHAHADSAGIRRYPVPTGEIGCSRLVETFCDKLWSPENLGNLDLGNSADASLGRVTLGRTRNETRYTYFLFSEARLAARTRLPKDFRERLDQRGYFRKLERALAHKPYGQMTKQEDEEIRALFSEIDVIWSSSLENTAATRTARIHPGFHKLTDDRTPTRISYDYALIKDELESSIWEAIWSQHPRWKLMNKIFDEIRQVFLDLVAKHPGASEEIKARWAARLRATKLLIPGADPLNLNDEERRCASTELNGYHSPKKNSVTLCGGYILIGDPARTIAHELAHTIGPNRGDYETTLRFPLADRLLKLRANTCTNPPYRSPEHRSGKLPGKKGMSCAEWKDWKKGYSDDIEKVSLAPEHDERYLACFLSKKLNGTPPDSTLDYIAREWVQSELETQAKYYRFIRFTKENEILRNGSVHPSGAYLDPCGIFYIYDGLDPYSVDFTLNVFFVNEYRCQLESSADHCTKSPELCLEAAIQGAEALEYQLRRKGLSIQTKYSTVRDLQRQGYAQDIDEDLSDHLGQLAYSKYLEGNASQEERRSRFLASLSPLCDEPSLAKLYPAEAQIQKKYYFDSHSEGVDRRRKLLIDPIRKALGCEKDFSETLPDCDWYSPQGPLPKPAPKPIAN